MKKKSLIALISTVSIIATTVLAGCGNSDNQQNAGNNKVSNIIVWTHVSNDTPDAKVYQQRIDEFNKKFDGKYKATIQYIPRSNSGGGYNDKVNAAIASNSLPDVLTSDGPDTAAWAEAKVLAPIDDYVSQEEKSSYVDSIIQQGTYQGKLYTLSPAETSVGLFYNKDLFVKAGITPATIEKPWTWTEFEANAKKLQAIGVKYPFNMNAWEKTEWAPYAFLPFFWSNGGDVIDKDGKFDGNFNSDKNVETGKFLAKLASEKLLPVTQIDQSKEFRAKNLAMYLSGPWEVGSLRTEGSKPDFEWGVMPMPVSDNWNNTRYTASGSWGFGMTTSSKDKTAASELVKWMTNVDSSKLFSKTTGNLPSHKSLADLYKDDSIMNMLVQQNVNTAHPRPVTPNYPIFREGFLRAIEGIFNGKDVKQSLDDGVKFINSNIKK
ncbi:carbohydrate ABC transporter substrate-binding protein, CUT1 family [Clostridium sp. USBA 49]|uniref:sugar ABC transporter substrate-binding protein n=1 Tax=Clostridium sp. USBA 49 TaxID=1881060 RepID=UPI00099AC054|nr:sugar ABC transporter substrate-binding protein [Clostridium sp. USBA 49]SKA85527.1 carbohydrate ABC transporter substrate-binding protein, CUT1 family [Clostridium sp. USBA 49]